MEFHAHSFPELLAARDAVRSLPRPWREDAIITVHGGIVLEATLHLGPEDSGRDGYRVVWRGVNDAQLGSGVAITGWRLHDAKRNLWCASAPTIAYFRQLWADSRRLTRVRGLVERIDNAPGYGHDRVHMREPYWTNSQLHAPFSAGIPAWIENAFELLGEPGQRIHACAANQVGPNAVLTAGPLPPAAEAVYAASGR